MLIAIKQNQPRRFSENKIFVQSRCCSSFIFNIRIFKNHNVGQPPSLTYRVLTSFITLTFIFTFITPPLIFAQNTSQTILNLPIPGTMLHTTEEFNPTLVRGITIHPENPLQFDFIIDTGDSDLDARAQNSEPIRKESTKLIKYFLASLTIPNNELWVNLSPYEKDRIIPENFGQTELGRDMLAQDYLLKQLTASLMYPEDELGQEFWRRVYDKAYKMYGTTEIPMNTFNKIWIVPQQADIYEHDNTAYIVESHLKIMLEEDYIALQKNIGAEKYGLDSLTQDDTTIISGISSAIVKEILIPEIEKEVNQGETFANLRQIYNSVILATWYKMNLKESLLGQVYANQSKIKGVDVKDKQIKQKIYEQYVASFKKGVYNYIREDYDLATQKKIPRKYFSGGVPIDPSKIIKNISSSITAEQREKINETGLSLTVDISENKTNTDNNSNITTSTLIFSDNWFTNKIEDIKNFDRMSEGHMAFVPAAIQNDIEWFNQFSEQDSNFSNSRFSFTTHTAEPTAFNGETAEDYEKTVRNYNFHKKPIASSAVKKTILLVDDDSMQELLYQLVLEDNKYDVVTATNGTEALKLLNENNSIQGILSDVNMPEMDGVQFAKKYHKLKEQGELNNIKFFVLHTAKSPDEIDKLNEELHGIVDGIFEKIPEIAAMKFIKEQLPASSALNPGGINLSSDLINLKIKRDGNGVPLQVWDQPIDQIRIDGFVPIIINITPINVPMLLGFDTKSDASSPLAARPNSDNGEMGDCDDDLMISRKSLRDNLT